MSTIRERQRMLREEVILDTAYDLLTERGYEKMNMDEVAARVGIAKVTLYQHFPSKEALTIAVAIRRVEVLEKELEPIYNQPVPAMERLKEIMRHSLNFHVPKWQANFTFNVDGANQNPNFVEMSNRVMGRWEKLIDEAKEEGSIDPAISTPVLARMIRLLFLPGYEDLLLSGRVTSEDLVDTLLTVIINGARPFPA